jgi:hypothetical protein
LTASAARPTRGSKIIPTRVMARRSVRTAKITDSGAQKRAKL